MLFPFSPPPGYNEDDSSFSAEGQWKTGDGFRFVMGKAETIGGAVKMSSASDVDRANKMLVYDAAGTIKLAVAGDTLRIAAPDTAGTDITPAANWTTGNDIRHCLAMYGDVLLAMISGGRLFESSAGAQAVAVTNAPTQSTAMIVTPSRQVMLLGTQEEGSGTFNGRCIRWSDIEDRTSWTTASTNNAGEYILPGQEDIVSACVFGDYILIWTEGSLWMAQFQGDPGQTFVFQRVADIGICGLDAFAIYRQTVYWISADFGFYSYQTGDIVQRIPCPVEQYFRSQVAGVSSLNMTKSFGCANSRFGEIWFAVPTTAAAPGSYFVYSIQESMAAQRPVWFYGFFSTLVSESTVGAMVESALPWDPSRTYGTQLIVTVYATTAGNAKPWRMDCAATSIAPSSSPPYIESADFYVDESQRRVMIRRLIPDFETQGGTVSLTLYTRDRPKSTEVTKGPYDILTTNTKTDFRASGKIFRAKLTGGGASNRIRLGKPLFDVVTLGER